MNRVLRIVGVSLAGILIAAAHPIRIRSFYWEVSWLNLVIATCGLCLFVPIALSPVRKRSRFFYGFLGGFTFFAATLYWITYALHEFGNINIVISLLSMFLLAAYCALYLGVWSLISGSKLVKARPILAKIFCWASLWASLEALRQWLFTGFSWGEIGFAFSAFPWIAKSASIWGTHGFTFLWIFAVGALLHLKGLANHLRSLGMIATAFFTVGGLGIAFFPSASDHEIRIGLVQPNVAQEIKWNPGRARDHFDLLVDLTKNVTYQGAELIIWPETSMPYSLSANQKELPFSSSVPIIFGAVVREGAINRNSAILMKGDEIQSRFDKIHLVPFGEYVPFKEWLSFGKLVQNAGDFLPGDRSQALLTILDSRVRMGPLICYEDIFARSSVLHARKGANLLINLTNDAWYGPTSAQAQHSEMAAMQVFQTGLPLVRSTNNGVSSFITSDGEASLPTLAQTSGTKTISIAASPRKTFFVWTYPLMEWIFPLIFVIALLWKNSSRTKRIFFPKPNSY